MKIRIANLNITSLTAKGNGLAKWDPPQGDPSSVEVPFTMPGDLVQAQVGRKRKGVHEGKLEVILSPSPERITPKCVHFGVCGGCRLQHMPYSDQLEHKQSFVHKCFQMLLSPDVEFRQIIPCSNEWQYRNKMEYSFSSDAAGHKYLGLIMDSSRGKVFNLTECHLTRPWFVDALKSVRQWWHESDLAAYHMYRNTGSLRTLTVREGYNTGDRMVILTVSGNPDFALHKRHIESFVAFLRDAVEPIDPDKHFSIFLRIQQTQKGMATNMYEMHLYGPDHIRETLNIQSPFQKEPLKLTFGISPSAFFQPNTKQAEKIYSQALTLAEISPDNIIYDLYCGTGAIGISTSNYAKEVIGIELSPEAVLDARQNAKSNGCHNIRIFSGDVRKVLKQETFPAPDVVIVDPPRAGLDPDAIKQLIELSPSKILYVSCNPITQAQNVAELLQHGYRIKCIQPIDQFPQTYHIENIVVLCRN